jgi:hypothetical protein
MSEPVNYSVVITTTSPIVAVKVAIGSPVQAADIASAIHAATAVTTPADADEAGLILSAAWPLRKITWGSIKAWVNGFLGAAAQLNVGTASGTVAAGNDSRILLGASAKQPGTTLAHYGIADAARAPEKKYYPFTAVVGGLYQLEGEVVATVFDPIGTPTTGDSYEVIVGSTSAGTQFNGIGTPYYPSRFPIRREYNGSAWVTTQPFLSDGLSFSAAAKATTLNNLQSAPISETTTGRILALSDASQYIRYTHASGCAITMPQQGSEVGQVIWPDGAIIYGRRVGAGAITLGGSGITFNNSDIANVPVGGSFALRKAATDSWDFI